MFEKEKIELKAAGTVTEEQVLKKTKEFLGDYKLAAATVIKEEQNRLVQGLFKQFNEMFDEMPNDEYRLFTCRHMPGSASTPDEDGKGATFPLKIEQHIIMYDIGTIAKQLCADRCVKDTIDRKEIEDLTHYFFMYAFPGKYEARAPGIYESVQLIFEQAVNNHGQKVVDQLLIELKVGAEVLLKAAYAELDNPVEKQGLLNTAKYFLEKELEVGRPTYPEIPVSNYRGIKVNRTIH